MRAIARKPHRAQVRMAARKRRYLIMSSRSEGSEQTAGGSSPRQLAIGDALSRTSHELVHVAWLLENLQCHIRPLIQEAAARDANALRQLQGFDHIGQILHGLADFLAGLTQQTPCQWLVDPGKAASSVTLADLSSRLAFTDEENNVCATAWGDCDLF